MTFDEVCAVSDMYQLLAKTMLLPDEALARSVLAGDVAGDAADILRELGAGEETISDVRKALSAPAADDGDGAAGEERRVRRLLDELRVDYTRLFTDPRKPVIMPYETVYVNGQFEQAGKEVNRSLFVSPAATDASYRYGKVGLSVDAKLSNEPADYIFFELSFLSLLHAKIAKCMGCDDVVGEAGLWTQAEEFERIHADRWFEGFFSTVEENGGLFYAGVARCYRTFRSLTRCK